MALIDRTDEKRQESEPANSDSDRKSNSSVSQSSDVCVTLALPGITRRDFVKTAGGAAVALPLISVHYTAVGTAPKDGGTTVPVTLTINGQRYSLNLDPRVTLLDLLRENLALTGSKKGCDHGQCGACTVIANGRRINSCLSLAVTHDGDQITTVEGLATAEGLHPVQAAFIEYDGFQCGYCTPGQICSAVAMLSEVKKADASFVTERIESPSRPATLTPDEIRERMSGNICRCGAYPGIVQAIQTAYKNV